MPCIMQLLADQQRSWITFLSGERKMFRKPLEVTTGIMKPVTMEGYRGVTVRIPGSAGTRIR